jgi:hypothetical protein
VLRCPVLCTCPPFPTLPPCAAHFSREREPKVLITTCYKPSKGMYAFLAEMLVRQAGAVQLAAGLAATLTAALTVQLAATHGRSTDASV